jgi:hypothetical protein
MTKTDLDPMQRAGLLTQGSFLALTGSPDGSNPVRRGKFVFTKLLCQTLPPPPANVPPPAPASAGGTTRQRFEVHDQNACAKGCHTSMDPIGFGFESYDGIGQWRTTDQGQTVDSSGTLAGTDVDGTFSGAVDLAHKLATSPEVRDCVATEWFRYAMGRGESADDACSLSALKQGFSASQSDIRQLLVAVTQTTTFRYRNEVTP